MDSCNSFQLVNNATTLCTLPSGERMLVTVHQALLDRHPQQREALLQPHQCRAHNLIVNDVATCHKGSDGKPGLQNIVDSSTGNTPPFYWDGWKLYLAISKPSEADMCSNLPHIELTSPEPFTPTGRSAIRRVPCKRSPPDLPEWQARLGFPPMSVVKHTLENSTCLAENLDCETREYMRDHFQTRLHQLRPKRLDDVLYVDTFFSSITSVRGLKCSMFLALKRQNWIKPT